MIDQGLKLRRLEASIAKDSLLEFVEMAWPIVEPGRKFVRNWHHELICSVLEAVTRGEIDRLVINVPPGCSKSSLVNVYWPVWEWLRDPTLRQAFASYDFNLSLRDSRLAYALVNAPRFRELFGALLPRGVQGEGDFRTGAKGRRFSTSIGGAITGNHFDRLVIDDPTKPIDIGTKRMEIAIEWWKGTASTRIVPGGAVVLIMQRISENDLAGELLESEKGRWVRVRLPMRSDGDRFVSQWGFDPRVEPGELLWPARFDERKVAELELTLGPLGVSAQLQQAPVSEKGCVIQSAWWRRGLPDPHESISATLISVDCTFKDSAGSDRVGIQVWQRQGPNAFMVRRLTSRLSFPETIATLRAEYKRWPGAKLLIEDRANGPAVISMLRQEIPGIVECSPLGGKVSRANAVAGYVQAGNVFLAPGADGDAVVAECSSFPVGAHDDDVDACTQALAYLFGAGAGLGALANGAAEAFERQWRMG